MRPLMLLLALFCSLAAAAQPGKVEGPLNEFVNTDFMRKFLDMRIEAENTVRRFKKQAPDLDPEPVRKVQTGYEQTAVRFNSLLENIKNDFLDKKKLKFISQYPEDYIKGLEHDLDELSEFYAVQFQQPLADATAHQIDGSPALLLIVELVGLTKGLIDYFGKLRKASRRYNEAYLQEHLILPYRFPAWREITAEGVEYQKREKRLYEEVEMPTMDPLLEDLSKTVEKTGNDNPYDEAETYDDWMEMDEATESDDDWFDSDEDGQGSPNIDTSGVQPLRSPVMETPKKKKQKKGKDEQ